MSDLIEYFEKRAKEIVADFCVFHTFEMGEESRASRHALLCEIWHELDNLGYRLDVKVVKKN